MSNKSFQEQYPEYELIAEKSTFWPKLLSWVAVAVLLIAIPLMVIRSLSYDVPTPAAVGDQRFTLPTLRQLAFKQTDQKDYPSAIVNFEKYFALGGQEADVMAMYAYSLSEVGRKDDALIWSRKAVAKDANSKAARLIHDSLEK